MNGYKQLKNRRVEGEKARLIFNLIIAEGERLYGPKNRNCGHPGNCCGNQWHYLDLYRQSGMGATGRIACWALGSGRIFHGRVASRQRRAAQHCRYCDRGIRTHEACCSAQLSNSETLFQYRVLLPQIFDLGFKTLNSGTRGDMPDQETGNEDADHGHRKEQRGLHVVETGFCASLHIGFIARVSVQRIKKR